MGKSAASVLGAVLFLAMMTLTSVSHASRVCEDFQSCAEVSIEKVGYVTSDCARVQNDAQDRCASKSIQKVGYVTSDCLTLSEGGRCAVASIERMGYVTSDCQRVANSRQDRCAVASLNRVGYVTSDCLRLP